MNKDENISTLANPYNFSNPIKDEALFFGRDKQLREIAYYLDQAAATGHPINLALLGERASGKTSYLNIIEKEAKRRKFCTARIDLNEHDVSQPGEFFAKLIDQLFTAACLTDRVDGIGKCFGGPAGATFMEYLEVIGNATEAPRPELMPLFTPLLAAKQRRHAGAVNAIPEALLKRDLETIRGEVGRPIALLFDECDVLTANRIVLQIVRNVFMALEGYLLVFAGTPRLFPLMDDVFSPVVRQFKRFDVSAFKSPDGTRQCVVQTLRSIGAEAVKQYLGLRAPIIDIHRMTGGKPYEIQLVCHFMFKNVQLGLAKRMELNVEVIEDVLQELDVSHQLRHRDLIALIKGLSIEDLSALRMLFGAEGYATAEEMYKVEEIVSGRPQLSMPQLLDKVSRFKEIGLLKQGERIVLAGDELERLYLRYFGRAVGLEFAAVALPLREFAGRILFRAFSERHQLRSAKWFGPENLPDSADDIEAVLQYICCGKPVGELDSIPSDNVLEAWEVLSSVMFEGDEAFDLLRLDIRGAGFDLATLWYGTTDVRISKIPSVCEDINSVVDRANAAGADAVSRFETLPVPTAELIRERVTQLPVSSRKKIVEHQEMLTARYYTDGSLEAAKQSALLGYWMDESQASANQGYVVMMSGDLELAAEILERATQKTEQRALAIYDLGILKLKEGRVDEGEVLVREAIAQGKLDEEPYLKLVVAHYEQPQLIFEERDDPSLTDACTETLAAIEQMRTETR